MDHSGVTRRSGVGRGTGKREVTSIEVSGVWEKRGGEFLGGLGN